MIGSRGFRAVARLDFAEVLRSRWLFFCISVYTLLAAVFVLVGLRESAVLEYTGTGRVLMSFVHVLVMVLPLLALTATGQVVNQARDNGLTEFLFTLPVSRTGAFLALLTVRTLTLLVPLFLLVVGMGVYGRVAFNQAIPWPFVWKSLALCTTLLWVYVCIGLLVSVLVVNQARAMIWLLLIWAASVALLDFALIAALLQWRLTPESVFLLAAANPVEAARLGLLSAVQPELSVYGPVGFYLANEIGQTGLLILGIAWPLALGTVAGLLAMFRFNRGDMV